MVTRRIMALVLAFGLAIGGWGGWQHAAGADAAARATAAQSGEAGYAALHAQRTAQAQSGAVAVYAGVERQGISGRLGCSFLDGIFNMRGELVDTVIIVTDPLNREYYRSFPIPEIANYAPRQMTCLRSAQTGTLVVTIGGFTAGGGTSQAITLATLYYISQPISFEEYLAGKR